MGVVVQFDFNALKAMFPEMEPVGATLLQVYWNVATTMHANDGTGPVGNAQTQSELLNMLTAHVAQLFAPRDASGNPAATGVPAPNMVGRLTSASEGTVSVQAEAMAGFNTAQAQWLAQTRYGALYWAATAPFRTFRYRQARWPRTAYGLFPLNLR